jgi:hypothetical protein
MKTLALIPLLLLSASVCATEAANNNEPLKLKNGSYLFINQDNTMRMVDSAGKPLNMKDGVEMELSNGDLIMMKGKRLWRHNHFKMK